MDIREIVENAVAYQRSESMKTSEQLTLGELILKLKPLLEKQKEIKKKYQEEANIVFDFCDFVPLCLSSWRGSYCELAIEYSQEGTMYISKFVKMLEEAIGETYEGYKGGDFTMGKTTPIWVSNYGNANDTAVVDVLDEEYRIVLITKYIKY